MTTRESAIHEVSELLLASDETVAVAESVTAGNLQAALSLAENATQFFQGGITVYNIGQKCRHLHIEPTHAVSSNCVSQRIAEEMAANVCRMFLSDWGIGITGYATPVPGFAEKKLFAYFAIAHKKEKLFSKRIETSIRPAETVQQFYVDELLKYFTLVIAHHADNSVKI